MYKNKKKTVLFICAALPFSCFAMRNPYYQPFVISMALDRFATKIDIDTSKDDLDNRDLCIIVINNLEEQVKKVFDKKIIGRDKIYLIEKFRDHVKRIISIDVKAEDIRKEVVDETNNLENCITELRLPTSLKAPFEFVNAYQALQVCPYTNNVLQKLSADLQEAEKQLYAGTMGTIVYQSVYDYACKKAEELLKKMPHDDDADSVSLYVQKNMCALVRNPFAYFLSICTLTIGFFVGWFAYKKNNADKPTENESDDTALKQLGD